MRKSARWAVAAAAALALVAGCGGGGGEKTNAPAAGKLTGRGPITWATHKDTSGNLQNQVNVWNSQHPNERVRLVELPEAADAQRQQLVQNAQIKSDAFSVLSLDVIWTDEFAANRWVVELPKDQFDLSKYLQPPLQTAMYRGRLYAMPMRTNAGLLFYRKDLLSKAGIGQPPRTWAEMWQQCDKVRQLPEARDIGCYGGQFDKYEGLTVNASEVINGAGGVVVGDDGKPNVNTPQAKQGLNFLVSGFASGRIPKEALTYKEEEGRRAFQAGKLLFHRQWPYQYALANKTDGSSQVAGKFDVAPLPGLSGPGVSTLGGLNLAISAFAKNKATALDFIKFMTGPDRERADLLATSEAPTLAALYDDAEMVKKHPYLPTLKQAILNAKPRPKVVFYQDVSTAISEEAYAAISGQKTTDQALADLQNKLGQLVKK